MRTVLHAGNQDGIRGGGRENAAPDDQHFAGEIDSLGKIAGHLGKSGDEEIAEAVAAEFSFCAKAMVEQPREEVLVLGECNHAVAQVAGRQHPEIAAKTAA